MIKIGFHFIISLRKSFKSVHPIDRKSMMIVTMMSGKAQQIIAMAKVFFIGVYECCHDADKIEGGRTNLKG